MCEAAQGIPGVLACDRRTDCINHERRSEAGFVYGDFGG